MAESKDGGFGGEALESLFGGDLAALFEDEEVSAYLKEGLKEAGCRAPFHLIVFALLKKIAVLGWGFGGQTLRSRLAELLARNRTLSRWLDSIANICRQCEDRNRLKDLMIAHIRGGTHAGPIPKIDDATEPQVLAQLYTKHRFDIQDAELAAMAAALQDVLAEKAGDAIAPHLGWTEGNRTTIADSIRYNSGLYDFEGREREVDLLHRFCGDLSGSVPSNRFSWLLLVAPGGEGKTRLALEYTTRRIGPGWRAGRLSLPDLQRFNHGEWLPMQPTLIVIDYPAQSPDPVHALLANLARRHRAFDWPVRVLLLEREAHGQWFDRVLPGSSDGAAIRANVFSHGGRPLLAGVPVEPLDLEAIASMMAGRFRKVGREPPEPALLLQTACRVDNRQIVTERGPVPRPRPLFAAAAAEVMIAAMDRGESPDEHWVAVLDREQVLAEIIRRDRAAHWLPVAEGNRELLLRHENLVALATLAGGFKRADLRSLAPEVAALLPAPGEADAYAFREDLVRRMSGYRQGRIGPLEPDLLGEYFLVDRLQQMDEAEGEALRRRFCGAAFEGGGMEAIGSALRTVLDFPSRAEALDWLLPDANASNGALMGAAGVVIDITNLLGLRANSAMDWLDGVGRLRPKDVGIALRVARAAVNVASHAGAEGDWARVDAMLARIGSLRAAFPQDAEIAVREGRAAYNVITDAAVAGEWQRVDVMLARIDELRRNFAQNAEIALQEAKAAVNVTGDVDRDEGRVEAMLARFDSLRSAFPDDDEIALQEAMAAVNLIAATAADGEWADADVLLTRIERLRSARPDDPKVAAQEAMGASNLGGYAAAAGEWAWAEAMLERGRKLSAEGTAAAVSGPLLRLWAGFLRSAIRWGRAPEAHLVKELLARFDAVAYPQSRSVEPADPNDIIWALSLIKHLDGAGYRETTARFVESLAAKGLDWSTVPGIDPGGGSSKGDAGWNSGRAQR